jgi:putative cell wall-binding protein
LARRATIAFVLALPLALFPTVGASAGHFGMLDVSVDIQEPGASGQQDVEGVVSGDVEFEVTAENTAGETLNDTSVGLNLPAGFTFSGASSGSGNAECDPRDGGSPDVLCDLGDFDGTQTITITADSTGRIASTITAVAYGTWEDSPAVYAMDNKVLADNTLRLADTTSDGQDGQVSFEVRNTSDDVSQADNVTVEVALPGDNESVTATVDTSASGPASGSCDQLAASNDNVVCQNISVPATGPLSDNPIGSVATPEISIDGLDDQAVTAEAKGDITTRAALEYDSNGDVNNNEFHDSASRSPAQDASGATRTITSKVGATLNSDAIALPATEFTLVGGEARMSVNDADNTGRASVNWTAPDGTNYAFEATSFRNLRDNLDYFQDGGVNFDTHQHGPADGPATYRPSGPDSIPDLWVQGLVYTEGNLTVTQPDGGQETFENVGMHAMYRQASADRSSLFQRWADKGPIPARDSTVDYDGEGGAPPLPKNGTVMDVLFANTPDGEGGCEFNGVAGNSCSPDLGKFVRLMTFALQPYQDGVNTSGTDLAASSPTQNVSDRFESLNLLTNNFEGPQSVTKVSLDASAKTFATAGDDSDSRTQANYAVVGRKDVFADNLAGSGLASDQGPILFTAGGEDAALNPTVRAELNRVLSGNDTVYVLGGPLAVSQKAVQTIEQDGFNVERLSGDTRFETAERVAQEVRARNSGSSEQLLARGFVPSDDSDPTRAWADSVSGGSYAADQQVPVLLTRRTELHPAAERGLQDGDTTFVLGGEDAVNTETANEAPNSERIAGATRIETSVEVSEELFGRTSASAGDQYVISPGFDELGWAYGLAAAPHSAVTNAPLLLYNTAGDAPAVPDAVAEYLGGLGYSQDASGYATTSSSLVTDYAAVDTLELLAGEDASS